MIKELKGDFFQQLRGFYYVCQLGSMGQAAKVMNRSQPSVSRLIKQLEDSLDVELFSRVHKGMVLTNEGAKLLEQAVAIFENVRSIHSELRHLAQEPAGEVSFQVSHPAFLRFVSPLLPKLHRIYPKLKLNILEAVDLSMLQKRLEERKIDFAMVVGGAIPSGLDFFPLFREKMVLVAPAKMERVPPHPLDLEKLPNLPIINMPSDTGFSLFVDNNLPSLWLASRQRMLAGNAYYQLKMVAGGLGFAVATESSLTLIPNMPFTVYSLSHIMPEQENGLVKLHGGYMTPQAKAVVEFFKENASLKP